jgi:hypothetical protein
MTNPFPGVDPFIEANGRWIGFHNLMIAHCTELLNIALPENYAAFHEERLELVDSSDEPRQARPDVSIARDVYADPDPRGATAVAEPPMVPAVLALPDFESVPEAYIDIRKLPEQELVTSIELLSPTNKDPHGGGAKYHAKRADTINQDVNLVEIDLLLAGRRPQVIGVMPPGHFFAFISRGSQRPRCEVYGWSIREKLPVIPIPLKAPDFDVALDLATAFSMSYERNRYHRTMRYRTPVEGSLSDDDRNWIAEIVKAL